MKWLHKHAFVTMEDGCNEKQRLSVGKGVCFSYWFSRTIEDESQSHIKDNPSLIIFDQEQEYNISIPDRRKFAVVVSGHSGHKDAVIAEVGGQTQLVPEERGGKAMSHPRFW
jgi:hypothetical protein